MQMGAPETLTVIGDAITNSLQTQQLQQQQQQQPYDWLYDHMTTALAQGHAMSICKCTQHFSKLVVHTQTLVAVHTARL
jgi:hypothetical protein